MRETQKIKAIPATLSPSGERLGLRLKTLLLLFLLSVSMSVSAGKQDCMSKKAENPDSKTVLKLLNETFRNLHKVSFDLSYRVYETHTAARPVEETNGKFLKSGNSYYWESGDQVVMSNATYLISLDQSNKSMLVADPAGAGFYPYQTASFDSLSEYCSDIKAVRLVDSSIRVSFFFQVPLENVTRMEIVASPEYLLRSINLFYETLYEEERGKTTKLTPRVEIRYLNTDIRPVFTANTFSEKQYFRIENHNLVCREHYKDYRIIDQRQKREHIR